MAYDEDLAVRTRDLLAELSGEVVEKKMFGGLAFMVSTNMACGLIGEDLMVRVGADGHEQALARGAREMEFTGRPMRGFVVVPGEDVVEDRALEGWVRTGVAVAESLPRKKPRA